MNLDPYLIPYVNVATNKIITIRAKTIKFIEENRENF